VPDDSSTTSQRLGTTTVQLVGHADCAPLTPAAFARFPFITFTALRWYPGVDALLLLAVAQDLWAGRRVHRVYAISLPLVVSGQIAAMWLYLERPTWWVEFAQHLF